ncbi:hypothetical protein ZHAS_00020987 [Anopheles sinensis]|uniref:Uncharacterized protein n=1 Tax=Anopheles sinensis TaxID=74873 RepID=A0A084WR67_ANOSI|nr:hypothetical protein ZHAS_00020987 [Anopheles sinensis]
MDDCEAADRIIQLNVLLALALATIQYPSPGLPAGQKGLGGIGTGNGTVTDTARTQAPHNTRRTVKRWTTPRARPYRTSCSQELKLECCHADPATALQQPPCRAERIMIRRGVHRGLQLVRSLVAIPEGCRTPHALASLISSL